MIPVDEARALLAAETRPLGTEEIALDCAHGRVLAAEVRADRDFPPTDRSAMDGFAVRAADLREPGRTLEVTGELRAGEPAGALHLAPGQAVRIMTGSVIPPGADAVVMVEHTAADPGHRDRIVIHEVLEPGQHIRARGEELRAGGVVLEPGVPIHAPEIAALASVGRAAVQVFRRPVVHVLSTGDEVVEADAAPAGHQVRNSNAHALLAQLAELGLAGRYLGIARDDLAELERRMRAGLGGDCLLITGGVSVGDYDRVAESLAAAGMRLLFHGVAMRPGKPILAGRAAGCLVVGLPGNPVSAYTGFAILVAPTLRRMMGHRRSDNLELGAALEEPLAAKPGRTTYHLAALRATPAGLAARRVSAAGSGDVLALARANGFVVTPERGAALGVGETVPAVLWRDFHLR